MRKAMAGVVSAAAFMLAPPVAGAQSIHIVNAAHLPARAVVRFETAAGLVANDDLRAQWGSPRVRWTRARGAVSLVLVGTLGPIMSTCGEGAAACHGVLANGQPVAVVDANQADTGVPWTVSASHELFEMLVDPREQTTTQATDGSGAVWLDEVADPVEDYWHRVRGVRLADFVYRAWFQNATGRQDAMGRLDDSMAGTGQFEFSCPMGYSQYWDPYQGEQTMGPAVGRGCSGSMSTGKPHGAVLRNGRDAHRDPSFAIGRPLKIKPWWRGG